MSWLKGQTSLLKEFLASDFRRFLLFSAPGMAAAIVLGALAGLAFPDLVIQAMQAFLNQIQDAGVMDELGNLSVFALLMNNWQAMLVAAACGFIPFLFLPVVSLLINGVLLGLMAALYLAGGALPAYLAGILPHGIFELPALILSVSCGICLCRNMCRLAVNSPRKTPLVELLGDLLRVLLLVVMPLTVAAAFVECYVTPLVMSLFL